MDNNASPERSSSGFTLVTLFSLVAVIVWCVANFLKRSRVERLIGLMPGPPPLPVIGNTIEINVEHDDLFTRIVSCPSMWGGKLGMYRAWLGRNPYVFIFKADLVEPIMSNSKHIDKSVEYDYLQPWLGTGLLTSSGRKWFSRRKILTPTFHFRILEDFMAVFREQSEVMVDRLRSEVGNTGFNLFPYVTLCALDIICETAMGQKINAQIKSNSDYVRAVYDIGEIVQTRQAKIWLQPDWLFRRSAIYKKHQHYINTLHHFSYKMIRERREEIRRRKKETLADISSQHEDELIGQKKRLAFLDLLIEASQGGKVLSNEDIREEVDTFMFEGHDTTSAGISWCLYLLGCHPEFQDKVYEELERVLGEEGPITMKALQELRYLECCIKEALRLYPSVPFMGRHLHEDITLGGFKIPAGTAAIILTYSLHRDPAVFPRPEVYNPDRFLPDNVQGRHPYAYIPFSAGPRNCIGQKFAMLEEKCVIATVLRHYRITSVDRRENLTLLGELILRPRDGLCVQISRRRPVKGA